MATTRAVGMILKPRVFSYSGMGSIVRRGFQARSTLQAGEYFGEAARRPKWYRWVTTYFSRAGVDSHGDLLFRGEWSTVT